MITSRVTDLVPVLGLPSGAGLQSAGLCAVWPQCGVAAMRRGAVHEPFTHAFPTAASALGGGKTQRCQLEVCVSARSNWLRPDVAVSDVLQNRSDWPNGVTEA